ncbi:MAG: hypothetical protein N2109_03530 [Fimbriimonadales bacterium]|nr:hypothetical protein [Fimbriimonadales bacterium]
MSNPFACRRFRRLCLEARDRDLAPGELRFTERHGAACPRCAEHRRASEQALSALRNLGGRTNLPCERLTGRVLRRFRVENVRQSFRYWSPALLAASVAAALVLAAIQVATRHPSTDVFQPGDSQARRITIAPVLPDLTPAGARAPSR